MSVFYADDQVTLHHGDALDVLSTLPDASVDAVVTDPPYGLEFMGREWDGADGFRRSLNPADAERESVHGRTSRTSPEYQMGRARIRTRVDGRTNPREGKSTTATPEAYVAGPVYQQWCQAWAGQCLRVLKPGGHMLAFGGTRTWHRLTCAVEDAGFEIRDTIAWIYGSGFPKSLDVSKAIDKAAGAEREVVGPVPYTRGRAGQSYSDTRRVSYDYDPMPVTAPATDDARRWAGWGTALKPAHEPIVVARKPLQGTVAANVLAHGTGGLNVDGCRVETGDVLHGSGKAPLSFGGANHRPYHDREARPAVQSEAGRWPANVLLDEAAAAELDRQSGVLISGANPTRRGSDKFRDAYGEFAGQEECRPARGVDTGGASRFYPIFKYEPKAPTSERPRVNGDAHETVKPLDLMRWLVRLVTPPGGLVLDPFAGSGTTAEACVIEGFRCVAVERAGKYLPLIVARLTKPLQPVLDMEVA